jgi:hypothetical protein
MGSAAPLALLPALCRVGACPVVTRVGHSPGARAPALFAHARAPDTHCPCRCCVPRVHGRGNAIGHVCLHRQQGHCNRCAATLVRAWSTPPAPCPQCPRGVAGRARLPSRLPLFAPSRPHVCGFVCSARPPSSAPCTNSRQPCCYAACACAYPVGGAFAPACVFAFGSVPGSL